MKKQTTLALMTVLALGMAGCKEKETTETTEKAVVNGTTVETTKKMESSVDGEGNRTTETEIKTTVDPEGAMNKETTEEIQTEETRQDPYGE